MSVSISTQAIFGSSLDAQERRDTATGIRSLGRGGGGDGYVEVDKVNVPKAWAKGASNAVTIFQQPSKFKHIDLKWYREQHLKGATLLQPKAGVQGMVGVSELGTAAADKEEEEEEEEEERRRAAGFKASEELHDIVLSKDGREGLEEGDRMEGGEDETSAVLSRDAAADTLVSRNVRDYIDAFDGGENASTNLPLKYDKSRM